MRRTRRKVLAAGGILFAAGCLETDSSTPEGGENGRDEAVTQSESDQPSTGTEDCQSGITVSTYPYEPVSDLPVSLDERERSIVSVAVDEGTADYTTYKSEPLRSDVIVRHDGAFYRTDFSLSTEPVPAYTMDLYWEDGQTAPEDGEVVAFADLPESDQTTIEAAALGPEEEGEGDGLPQSTLSIQEYPAPYPDNGTDSRLIGSRTWVRWRDHTMRIDVAGESESTTDRRTFEYRLERVAEDEAAFREFVSDRYVVALDDLSPSQRSLLTQAIEDRYEECRPPSTALAELRDRLTEADPLPHPNDDSWYVAFEGERYRLRTTEWVH